MNRVTMILGLVAFASTMAFGQVSTSNNNRPLELGSALQKVHDKLPKWRATLSAVDVESLPIQYKTGKDIEFLKSAALEQLNSLDKTSSVLEKTRMSGGVVKAQDVVQLLLEMQDAASAADRLASPLAMMSLSDQKTVLSWITSVLDLSTDLMIEEKRTEVPVMELLAARDALLHLCTAKPE